jgi:hypothetical protein
MSIRRERYHVRRSAFWIMLAAPLVALGSARADVKITCHVTAVRGTPSEHPKRLHLLRSRGSKAPQRSQRRRLRCNRPR